VFTEFFYLLRAYGVPVTVTEWLTFMEALAGGLVAASLNDFYAVGRAIMVKSEAFFDQYDQAFQHAFQGIEIPQEIADQVWEWLRDPLALPGLSEEEQRALLQQFGAIDLDELKFMSAPLSIIRGDRHSTDRRGRGAPLRAKKCECRAKNPVSRQDAKRHRTDRGANQHQ